MLGFAPVFGTARIPVAAITMEAEIKKFNRHGRCMTSERTNRMGKTHDEQVMG
jgi:hypothetical protein